MLEFYVKSRDAKIPKLKLSLSGTVWFNIHSFIHQRPIACLLGTARMSGLIKAEVASVSFIISIQYIFIE